ncbi:glycosyltransferase family 39 protein [Nitrosococcus wardiae]|uniref:Glycosyltransferase RgtA/B/C/D-like domain-containing protein n=1 Tax=Nitrosococcus wardiae TaxID=1814290 RepID=A0A4V1AVU8_9GAMM|nr:glycosyltransferase family 39 protein [Nitrosococcus wardiae]QBQ54385.1 hypothetical protein E3U44_07575 [Nitrosococcus wardiae]
MWSTLEDARIRHFDWIALLALTFFALVTRSYGLSEWPLVHDEYSTVHAANERYTSLINPAYYTLVVGSFNLFGISEWSARLPAMLLGVLSVPIFYLTWRNVLGRNVALIGALFIIFSSWHLWYSQFSRFYTGVFLFGSLSYYFYYQAIRSDSLRYLVWAILANIAAILFHLTSVMVPASCALFSLIILFSRKGIKAGYSRRIAATHIAICSLAGLISLSFLWQIAVRRMEHAGGVTWGDGAGEMILNITRHIQLPIAVSAFFGMLLLLRKDIFKGLFFMIGIGMPIIFVVVCAIFLNSRSVYMFYAFPLLLILAAYLCEQAMQALSNYGVASYAFAILLIILLLPETISHYTGRKSLDIREAVEFVEKAYRPNDIVLAFPWEFTHYAGGKFYMVPRPGSPRVSKVAWKEELQLYTDKAERMWIILESFRAPYAKELESWLMHNALLVWRKYEQRIDYAVRGYEIYLVNSSKKISSIP